jgi:hypothetical protein
MNSDPGPVVGNPVISNVKLKIYPNDEQFNEKR